ncbi:MAG TPA: hypothetical protein VFZ77_18495, partial [Acidimicrobiales bacterium]
MTHPIPSNGPSMGHVRPTVPVARSRAVRTLTVVLAAGLALGLAACGDDDDATAADAGGVTDPTPAAEGEAASADVFCDAALTLETAPGPDVDFAAATDEQIAAAAQAWATEVLRPLADEVAAAEIAPEIDVLSGVVDELGETGDVTAFDAPDASAANDRYMDFVADEC